MKKISMWNILPFIATALPFLIEIAFLGYYTSPNPKVDTLNWPSPGSTILWVQYILLATSSLTAAVINIVGIIKTPNVILKIIFGIFTAVVLIIFTVAVGWILDPSPY